MEYTLYAKVYELAPDRKVAELSKEIDIIKDSSADTELFDKCEYLCSESMEILYPCLSVGLYEVVFKESNVGVVTAKKHVLYHKSYYFSIKNIFDIEPGRYEIALKKINVGGL